MADKLQKFKLDPPMKGYRLIHNYITNLQWNGQEGVQLQDVWLSYWKGLHFFLKPVDFANGLIIISAVHLTETKRSRST